MSRLDRLGLLRTLGALSFLLLLPRSPAAASTTIRLLPADHVTALPLSPTWGAEAPDVSPRPTCSQLVAGLRSTSDVAVRWRIVESLGTIRSRTRRNGRVTFFLDFRPHGTLWSHRSVPMLDEAHAANVLKQIRATVALGRDLESVLADFAGSKAGPSHVTTWLAKWLDHMRRLSDSGQRSPTYLAALDSYAQEDGHFAWWRGRSIHDIKKLALNDWFAWLLSEQKLSAKSAKNVLDAFRSFTGWLVKDCELLPRAPHFPTVQVDEPVRNIPDLATQAKILDAIPEERRGIFLALCLCIRPGEARALAARDYTVDADGVGWLTINKAAKGKTAKAPIRGTKTKRGRLVPVTAELRAWIERHCDVSPAAVLAGAPLFLNHGATNTSRRWTDGALHKVWNRACKAAGVSGVSLYVGTKHAFATHLLASGVDERTGMALTGHREARSWRRYAEQHPSALVVALNRAKPTGGTNS